MTTKAPPFPFVLCKRCGFQPFHLTDQIHYCSRCLTGWSIAQWDSHQFDEGYADNLIGADGADITERVNLHRVGLVARYCETGKKLLDFGCGVGSFLNAAKKAWECEGVEANHDMIDAAKRAINLPIHYSIDDERYDILTFWDSLDHLHDLDTNFKGILESLNPGGFVFITLPELQFVFDSCHDEGYLKRVFSEWEHNEPTTRLRYFTKNGLERWLKGYGLRVIRIDNDESVLTGSKVNPKTDYVTMVATKPEVLKPGPWTLSGPGVGLG